MYKIAWRISTVALIKALESRVECDLETIAALKQQPVNFAEDVVSTYIEVGRQDQVAKYYKEMGIRSIRGTIFSAADVRHYIYDHKFNGYATIRQKIAIAMSERDLAMFNSLKKNKSSKA